MFEPVRMNHYRPARTQMPYNRDPFLFQYNQQMPLNRSPMNLSRFLSGNIQQYSSLNKGIGGFASILDNLQQVLRVVETTTPIIKEYGPMIKNLPAMYRMVKAFKSMEGLDDIDEGKNIEDTNTDLEKESHINEVEIKREKHGLSTPKLFI